MRRARRGTASRPGPEALRREILRFLEDTRGRRNWAHQGLAAAVRGLGLAEATWTPPAGHSVWQQINHIIHWKRYIVQRIRGQHPRINQAWPAAGRTLAGLRRAIAELAMLHRDLHRAVERLAGDDFTGERRRYNSAQLLLGAAAHESYHIGQIFLTRRLYRQRRRRAG